jgi:hypothetical protein
MKLANSFCRFLEVAREIRVVPPATGTTGPDAARPRSLNPA